MAAMNKNSSARWRVLVTSKDAPAAGIDLLRTRCDVTIIDAGISTRHQVLENLKDQDAVFLASHHIVDQEFLDKGKKLKVVSTMSAGYDHLDVPAIKNRGIKVGHTPVVLSAAVAEIAVLLMLSAARRVHEGRKKLDM